VRGYLRLPFPRILLYHFPAFSGISWMMHCIDVRARLSERAADILFALGL
jgi:hypothetical protein